MIYTVDDVPTGTKAYVNGKEVLHVVESDLDKGSVLSLAHDEEGKIIIDNEDFRRVTHVGSVRIVFPDGTEMCSGQL